MSRRALGAALAAAMVAAGCGEGGPPADLFVVERSGSVPGARLELRLTDDGGAYCNGGERREVSSAQLLEARELQRELDGDPKEEGDRGLADDGFRAGAKPDGAGGLRTIFSYRVRSEDGTISFADTSTGPGDVLPRFVKLTRDVARGPCGLPR
ncbi:hypothetical protein [Conexibacter sp. SYSU D00693]|uniref:hypothetical protein n=1 Tax=Conexibacter sp. SYSU D00693 TaxID=2812560 RepID=UPI00196BB1BB|nr:hypothetical protein [Conexibacter sp. SYSU D00693]